MLVLSVIVMLFLSPPLTLVMLLAIPLLLFVSVRMRGAIFPATWDAQQRAGEVAGVVDEAVTGVRVVKGFGQEQRELDHLADAAGGLYASRSRLVRLQARYSPALQAIPAYGQVGVLAARWLARAQRRDLARHVPGVLHLPHPARRPGAHVRRAVRDRAAGARRWRADPRHPRRQHARRRGARRGRAPRRPRRRPLRGRAVRLHAQRTGARRLRSARRAGRGDRARRRERLRQVDGHGPAPALLRRRRRAGSRSTASTCAPSRSTPCAARWAWCSRTRSCSPTPSTPTSPTARPTRPTPRSGPPPTPRARPASSTSSPTASTRSSASAASRSRAANGSASRSRGPSSATRAILLLDDATSAVDAATEEAIHATLRELMAGRTTILIAHRRSTLRLAQRIALIEQGRVADLGTHEELLARNERYRLLLTGPELEDDPDSLDLIVRPRGRDRPPSGRRRARPPTASPRPPGSRRTRCRSRPRPWRRPRGSDRVVAAARAAAAWPPRSRPPPSCSPSSRRCRPPTTPRRSTRPPWRPSRPWTVPHPRVHPAVAELAALRPRAGGARQRAHAARAAARGPRSRLRREGRRHHRRLGLQRDLLRRRLARLGRHVGRTRGSPAAPPSARSTACASRSSPTSNGCRSTTTTVSSTVGS